MNQTPKSSIKEDKRTICPWFCTTFHLTVVHNYGNYWTFTFLPRKEDWHPGVMRIWIDQKRENTFTFVLVNSESIALFVAGVELYLPPLAFCHYNIVCILPRPASLNSSTFPYILLNPDIQKVCMQVKFFKQSLTKILMTSTGVRSQLIFQEARNSVSANSQFNDLCRTWCLMFFLHSQMFRNKEKTPIIWVNDFCTESLIDATICPNYC